MTYEQFIEELRRLITEGQAFVGNANPGTREFRDWRLDAETTVRNMRKDGYDIPGIFGSEGRSYAPNWAPANPQQKRAYFGTHLGDSLAELRLIVRYFENHGAPQRAGSQPAAAPLPASADTNRTVDKANLASYGQSGGITAHTVNIAPAIAPASAAATPPRRWWWSWWTALIGLAAVISAVIAMLSYFGIIPHGGHIGDGKVGVTSYNQSGGYHGRDGQLSATIAAYESADGE